MVSNSRRTPQINKSYKAYIYSVLTGLVHDAVLMWAYGVNRTLERGGAPDDGETIASNIFNLSFQGITGNVLASWHQWEYHHILHQFVLKIRRFSSIGAHMLIKVANH